MQCGLTVYLSTAHTSLASDEEQCCSDWVSLKISGFSRWCSARWLWSSRCFVAPCPVRTGSGVSLCGYLDLIVAVVVFVIEKCLVDKLIELLVLKHSWNDLSCGLNLLSSLMLLSACLIYCTVFVQHASQTLSAPSLPSWRSAYMWSIPWC